MRQEEDIIEIMTDLGYKYISCYKVGGNQRVVFEDSSGYKYDFYFGNLFGKNKNPPSFVFSSNPFSLENISLWLIKNKKNFELIDENKYKSSTGNLYFHCHACDDIFSMSWYGARNGRGCPICSGKQVGKRHSFGYLYPDLLNEWHPDNKISPFDIRPGTRERIKWICRLGHIWETVLSTRTSKNHGCPFCAGQKPTNENNFAVLFPELLIEWDYERNGDPKKYLSRTTDYVWWICSECGNRWQSEIEIRTCKNCGCKHCNASVGNKRIRMILKKSNIAYSDEHRFQDCKNTLPLPFDFYLDEYNLCIEYNGIQHYEEIGFFGGRKTFDDTIIHDKIKSDYCYNNDINLLVIPYWDLDNIESIIEQTLNELSIKEESKWQKRKTFLKKKTTSSIKLKNKKK